MEGSYIMVDPLGRFFQNRPGAFGYDYSPPILEVGADRAFAQIGWSVLKFARRYAPAVVAGEVPA
jgi:radical S-adenosyl methionine domain-containing protein 2